MKNIYLIFTVLFFLNGCLSVPHKTLKIKFNINPSNQLLVDASINGSQGVFMLDTGSAPSISERDFTNKNKFKTVKYNQDENHQNLKDFEFLVGDYSIEVGKNKFIPTRINSMDLRSFKWTIDGVLGMDFLASEGFELNYKAKTLILSPKKASGEPVPLRLGDDNIPYVTISINGCQFEMMLDTGANTTYFNEVDWERAISCSEELAFSVRTSNTDFSGVKTGIQTEISGMPIRIGSQAPIKTAAIRLKKNLLGMNFLSNYKITYLQKTDVLYFEKFK